MFRTRLVLAMSHLCRSARCCLQEDTEAAVQLRLTIDETPNVRAALPLLLPAQGGCCLSGCAVSHLW